jgi:MtN3 and saliva related transmembrane protein
MNYTTIIGILASTFTSLALLPQLIKLIRERKAEDISLIMLTVLFIGLGFWIYYGILIEDWIVIIANTIALLINLITGILATMYSKR